MYENFLEKVTPKIRLIIAGALMLVGVVYQKLSPKTLDMYAFYIMAAAILMAVSVIICKISSGKMDPFFYTVLNLIVLVFEFNITAWDRWEGIVLYSIWILGVVASFIIGAVVLENVEILKRILMGLLSAVLNVVGLAVCYFVPVILQVFA